ncbi:MAG: hypothetical protein LBC75_02480 [Fibromonadaceae bacterium]|jgi:hypothetical protein|nr:hypothetical protein [Fibromonadaceae bacterium]
MKLKRNYKPKHPKYKTDAERKAAKLEAARRYRDKNREVLQEYNRDYRKEKYRKEKEAKGLTVKPYKAREFD